MASISKEQDPLSSVLAGAGATPPAGAKPQPAAVEIPVTVNGARTVEGTEKREPFSENTQTVLVFANGAVIRLASAVASGQLLFLTNDRTKKEVVCQVVKSKNYSRENGYVELEFTEAAPGFWGMRFPSTGTTAGAPVAAKLAVAASALPQKSLQDKRAEEKAKTQSAPGVEVPKAADPKLEEAQAAAKGRGALPVVDAEETIVPARVVASPAKPLHERLPDSTVKAEILRSAETTKPAEVNKVPTIVPGESVLKIPTLSEFLTNGAKGPELRAAEIEKPATPELDANDGAKSLTENGAAAHEHLSSLIFQKRAEPSTVEKKPNGESDSNAGLLTKLLVPTSTANTALAVKANPAPGTSTFDFGAEEVKIPAWLEPLARNSPASAAVFETKTPEIKIGESGVGDSGGQEKDAGASTALQSGTEYSEKHEAVLTLSSEGPTPNFGSSLTLDATKATYESGGSGSRKGLLLALLAIGLLLAAAAVWYWYSNQQQTVSASEVVATEATVGGTSAPNAAAPVSRAAASPSADIALDTASNRNLPNEISVRSDSNGNAPSVQPPVATSSSAPESAKPKLGHVHLSAPVVNRSAHASDNGGPDSEPTLNDSGVTGADPGTLGLLNNKGKQPTAPLAVGGEVKQARLISSVPPVYPKLAKSQQLSGDVVIDVLIDVRGNVSTMKVISGPAMLHQAAMDALRQWKYQPATLNGQPTPMHLTVMMQFKLP